MKADLRAPSPRTARQLVAQPISAMSLGTIAALPLLPFAAATAVLVVAAIQGVVFLLVFGWQSFRSNFGAIHWMWSSFAGTLVMGWMLGTISLVLVVSTGRRDSAPWVLAGGWACLLSVWLLAAWLEWRRLHSKEQGDHGSWAQANLDRQTNVMASLVSGRTTPGTQGLALAAVALGVNVPLVFRLAGVGEPSMLALMWIACCGLVVWVCGWHLGPMLGRAWFVRGIERRERRVFSGEGLPALQQLRRQHWLGRYFT